MKKLCKKPLIAILIFVMLFSLGVPVEAKTSVRLNKTSAKVQVNKKITLKVKGTSKKVKWSSKNKSIAKVSQKGVVTGKTVGKTTIIAKVAGKTLKCKITVYEKVNPTPEPEPEPEPEVTKDIYYLRDYIMANGLTDSDGNKYVEKDWGGKYGTTKISYNPKLLWMTFEKTNTNDSGSSITTMSIVLGLSSVTINAKVTSSFGEVIHGTITTNMSNITSENHLTFNKGSDNNNTADEEMFQDMNNVLLDNLLTYSETYLLTALYPNSMTLKDIGFESYE